MKSALRAWACGSVVALAVGCVPVPSRPSPTPEPAFPSPVQESARPVQPSASAQPSVPSSVPPQPDLVGRLAFDDGRDIYLLDLATGAIRRLTDDPARDINPAWSPDGRTIAYRSNRAGTDDVWLMDADGRRQRNLSRTDDRREYGPTWSPDGRWVAFNSSGASPTGLLQIRIVAVDGSSSRDLRTAAAEFPDWSPDGRRIAFASMAPGAIGVNPDYDLRVIDVDGSGERSLTQDPLLYEIYPQWSPDGSRLAFQSGPVGVEVTGLWTVGADGEALTQLTSPQATSPTWSPTGEWLAFVDPTADVRVIGVDGSDPIDLGVGPRLGFLSWAP